MTEQHFGYSRIVELFDKDETAGSFLREDGEGGFASGVYRMAREIERLRAMQQGYREEASELRIENERLRTAEASAYERGWNDAYECSRRGPIGWYRPPTHEQERGR